MIESPVPVIGGLAAGTLSALALGTGLLRARRQQALLRGQDDRPVRSRRCSTASPAAAAVGKLRLVPSFIASGWQEPPVRLGG
ncbi:hypothetical protein [Streptomyces cadmiisoli]|uniref:hypothetical protein n=1 Tax=Streptomyces cadmiisoli TaxID=2184053 RepID=UPI0036492E79